MVPRFIPVLSVIVSMLCLPGRASGADVRPSNDPAVVEINGVTLTVSDLERKSPATLFQARTAYYDVERKTVEEFIDQYLLSQQARQENMSVAQLLERHVDSSLPPNPSDEALRILFEGLDTTEPYEAVRDKIIDVVREKRLAKAKAAYLQTLRNQAKVIIRLAPPRAPIAMNDSPVRGASHAPVTLLEYADYECPYCQQIQPALDRLAAEYRGKMAFAYKDFPLPMHPNAQKAAEASRCAELQGKYWEYHDLLVTSKQLEMTALKTHARTLKLEPATFDKCLDAGEAAEAVKRHASEAQALGVQGTPAFFVNGRSVSGAASYERLRGVIAEELSAAEANSAAATAASAPEKKGPAR
jgi:protein-disulfide isomerase